MSFWFILISFGLAYIIQLLLTMLQMKNFNLTFKKLRVLGKVAIGKKKGGILAGSIVMFAVDDSGVIIKGLYISGVTVLARFKEIKELKGFNISKIDEENISNYPLQIRKAIINASDNYNTIMSGGCIEEAKSPLQKLKYSLNR